MFGRKQPEPVQFEWSFEFTNAQYEDDIRRIIREELAELLPVDVPDTPEDLR